MTRAAWIAVGAVSALAVGLAIALAVALGGDEGDTAGPGVQLAPGGEPSAEFQECMSDQGVEPPQPGVPQQQPPAGLEEAFDACRDLLPEGAGAGGAIGPVQIAPPG